MKIIRGLVGVVAFWGFWCLLFAYPETLAVGALGIVLLWVTVWVFMIAGGYD